MSVRRHHRVGDDLHPEKKKHIGALGTRLRTISTRTDNRYRNDQKAALAPREVEGVPR